MIGIKKYSGVIRKTVIGLLLLFAVIEIVYIRSVKLDYSRAEGEYANLAAKYALTTDSIADANEGDIVNITDDSTPLGAAADESNSTVTEKVPVADLAVDSEALLAANPDYVGWIYIPGLNISYPAVQDTYPGEYLRKTFDGKSNTSGCIFLDGDSKPDFSGYCDFLFGHNMQNGTMFANLLNIKDSGIDIYDTNPDVFVYTPQGKLSYRIFAWFTTENGSEAYNDVKDEAGYKKLLSYIKANSMVYSPDDIDFSDTPEILNLSTCASHSATNERFVVSCVRVN